MNILSFLLINFLPAGIFQKVLSSSNVVTYLFPVTCKSSSVLHAVTGILMTCTENIQKHILNIEHRHVIFTIPKECREFSFYDRSLLSKLSAAVNQIFKFTTSAGKKFSEHSKYYFTNSDIVHYGLISVIHTFGRYLKWNPHLFH